MNLEDLKQAVAAVKSVEDLPTVMANVASFVDIIAKASEEQAAARAAAEQNAKNAEATLTEVKAQLEALSKSHNDLLAAQQAAAAEAAFQSRMAAVEEIFAFDDEARADVNEEIKACTNDEAFAKWMARAKRMYKGFMKKKDEEKKTEKKDAKASDDMDEDDKKDGEMKEKECEAASKTALASAKDNITDAAVHNSIEAGATQESIVEQYKKTALKHIRIGGETAEELTAKAKATVKKTR